jgi:energy-coupling factor transporter ATP-binding protein EcfA2/ABC-type multidrug transport system permease subunit
MDSLIITGTIHGGKVSSAEKKGISGGQRKRVNLAMELLTDPSLLFLDEPTSGLSSEDALSVMKLLRGLADSGKTILLTIHQPGPDVFQLLDNLAVVSKDQGSAQPGRLVYYGPAYPGSINFFNPDSPPGLLPRPEDVLRGLANDTTDSWLQRYSKSEYHSVFVSERSRDSAVIRDQSKQTARDSQRRSTQWLPLVRRCFAIKRRDTTSTAVLLAQAPIIALLITLVFGRESSKAMDPSNWAEVSSATSTTVFLLALAALWCGCSNSVREIVAEWAIYHRERMVTLRIVPYIGSKFAVLGSLCLVQCLVLLLIVHWGCGLQGPWLGMLSVLVLVSLVGLSIGLMISALARTSEVAVAVLPLILLPMIILGGVLQPLHKMHESIQFAAHMMPSRWAFEALLLMESEERGSRQPPTIQPNTDVDYRVEGDVGQDLAESWFPKDGHRRCVFAGVIALIVMLGVTLYANYTILSRRDVHMT